MSDAQRPALLIVATSAFWVILFGAYLLFAQRRPPAQPIVIAPPPTLPPSVDSPSATPAPLRVYVSGAVQNPGVYRLPPDSLVQDAVEMAGGSNEDADLIALNLAHLLIDGEQIYVPRRGETPPALLSAQPSSSAGSEFEAADLPAQTAVPIDLNTATAVELEALPGIGPKTAAAIIAGRPYSSVEDLLRVKGIGEATLEKLRPYVKVE